jgi:ureidoacrylate peracid hydrolase
MGQTALLVIDVQNIYADAASPLLVPQFEASLARINELVRGFAAAGRPVIYVRHVHRADGADAGRMFDFTGTPESIGFVEGSAEAEYVPGLEILPGAPQIVKHRYSCFEGTALEEILGRLDVSCVAVCGYMTNFCCESTARAAHDRDYFVDFLTDATGAPDLAEDFRQEDIRRAVSATLAGGFARIFSTEAYLALMR